MRNTKRFRDTILLLLWQASVQGPMEALFEKAYMDLASIMNYIYGVVKRVIKW